MASNRRNTRLYSLEPLEQRLALSGSGYEVDPAMFHYPAGSFSLAEYVAGVIVETMPTDYGSTHEDFNPLELPPHELEEWGPATEHELDAFWDELGSASDYPGMPGFGHWQGLEFGDAGLPSRSDGVGADGGSVNGGSPDGLGSGLPHDLGGEFGANWFDPLEGFNTLIDEMDRHGMGDIPQGEGVSPLLNPRMTGSLVAGGDGDMGKPVRTPWGDDGGEGEEKNSSSNVTTEKYGTGSVKGGETQTYYRTADGQVYVEKDGNIVPDNGALDREVDMLKVFGGTKVTTTNAHNSGFDVIEVTRQPPSASNTDGEADPADFEELRIALSQYDYLVDDTSYDDPRILLLGNPIGNTSREAGNGSHTADHASGDLVNPVVGEVSGGDGGRYPIDFAPGADGDTHPHELQLSPGVLKYWEVVDPDER